MEREALSRACYHSIVPTAQPGDLILVRSSSKGYGLGRAATGNTHDHIAVVVRDDMTTNIVSPATKKIPVERMLKPHLQPVVLRPAWRSDAQREAFVTWMESLDAKPYDVRRTLFLIPRLLLKHWLRIAVPFRALPAERERWICTDAVFIGLEAEPDFQAAIRETPLDWVTLRCATTNDFLRLAEARPDILRRV